MIYIKYTRQFKDNKELIPEWILPRGKNGQLKAKQICICPKESFAIIYNKRNLAALSSLNPTIITKAELETHLNTIYPNNILEFLPNGFPKIKK